MWIWSRGLGAAGRSTELWYWRSEDDIVYSIGDRGRGHCSLLQFGLDVCNKYVHLVIYSYVSRLYTTAKYRVYNLCMNPDR